MKNYSIKDIAKIAGVSVATVSRVINDNGRFSTETKEKVLKVIAETGYKMNYSAKNLRMNKSFTVGILVPDISNYFFSAVVQKLESILFDKGYSTIICNTARNTTKEHAYLHILEGKGVDGLIVISGAEKFDFDSSSSTKKIPYICIDREPKNNKSTIFISSNHYQGAFDATEELIKNGCKHPIIAMHSQHSTSAKERLRGFQNALAENRYTFSEKQNLLLLRKDDLSIENTVFTYLKQNPLIDGIFSINDLIALDLMRALKKYELTIPKDIKLIGFDDIYASHYTTPSLSSVKQDTHAIAQHAADSLVNLMTDQKQLLGNEIIVPVALISRESSQSV